MRIPILLTTLALFLTPLTGCSQLTEFATGECSGAKTAILPYSSPTLAAHSAFLLDQAATTLDQALERCDDLGIATFASTPAEVDLKGVTTTVEGRNSTTRPELDSHRGRTRRSRSTPSSTSTSSPPRGSDVVAAIRFATSTYIGDDRDGARIVLITDGLATLDRTSPVRRPWPTPRAPSQPSGPPASDSLTSPGIEVEIVGIGHSDEADPLPRDLVDTLGDVWQQALARSGATVEIREALPNSRPPARPTPSARRPAAAKT